MEAYFEKLLETRGALECALVYLAAQKATPEDGKKLQQPLSYDIARMWTMGCNGTSTFIWPLRTLRTTTSCGGACRAAWWRSPST